MNPIRYVKGPNPYSGLFPKELSAGALTVSKKLFIVGRLIDLMQEQNISRTELATRMGVQPSRITALLNGTANLTIDTLVRAGMALGAELHQTFVPAGKKVTWVVEPPAAKPAAVSKARAADKPTRYRAHKPMP